MSLQFFGRALPFSVVVLMSLFALAKLPAQDNPTAVDAGSAEVKADAAAPSQAAANADLITLEGEDLQSKKAKKATDLLEQVSGIAIKDSGSGGGVTQVSIRGSGSDQVLIIIDGRRLNDSTSGAPDLAQLSADQIERIEILRGGAATAYGADALGGVVFITTKKNLKNGLDILLENKSYFVQGQAQSLVDAQRINLTARLGNDDVRMGLHGSFVNDLGIFAYKDAVGGDQVRKQIPTDFGSGGIDLSAPLGNGEFSVNLAGQGGRTGAPGSLSYTDPAAYTDEVYANFNLAWKTDSFISDALDFSLRLTGAWHEYKYYTSAAASDNYNISLDARQSALIADWLTLNYGLAGNYEVAFVPSMLDNAGLAPHRLSGGVFLNPEMKFGAFTIDPAVRADFFSDFPMGFTASLGIDFAASDLVTLRLSGGRSYKTPTFNFLWWNEPPIMVGNPNLKPESAWNADAGIVIANKNISSRSSGFVRYVTDGIIWYPNPSPKNIDYALYPGFDQDVSIKLDWFRAGVNYEFLHSYYLSGSNTLANDFRVANTPEHRFGFRVGGVWEHFELQLDGQVVGAAYADYANGTLVAAYCVLNASASYHFDAKSEIYLAADNLLNASYQVNKGYPMPGFALRLGLKAAF